MIIVLSFASQAPLAADGQDPFAQMSEDQARRAGLYKLTAEERGYLLQWLQGQAEIARSQAPTATAPVVSVPAVPTIAQPSRPTPLAAPTPRPRSNEFGAEQLPQPASPEVPQTITARLIGEFRGWDGDTVFRLDNGQIWRQRVGGRWRSPKRTDPEVTLEKGRIGYYLSVEGSRRSVGVKRIQ